MCDDDESQLNQSPMKGTTVSPSGVVLPTGWLEVQHESGLPCFVHADTHTLTWSRPYTLPGNNGGIEELLRLATNHVPPLNIFGRRSNVLIKATETDEVLH